MKLSVPFLILQPINSSNLLDTFGMQIHFPAEWEPQSAIQFTFPHKNTDWVENLDAASKCFAECITHVTRYQKALVVCANKTETQKILSEARQNNLILVQIPSDDTWARDHGPITVIQNGKIVLNDFIFNGWGGKYPADQDNRITQKLFSKNIFNTDFIQHHHFVLEGGGIETDGQGTLLTTSSCLLSPERNPTLNKKEIEAKLKKWLGVHRILWLNHGHLIGDDTDGHIDTLARFCSPNSIAYVRCDNPTDPHFEELKKMETELKAFKTVNGQPYQLIPLPWPDPCFDRHQNRLPATYANFLIINQAVLVPMYNVPQDKAALKVLQACFPDRKIIGINCRPLIEQHGSLHCITMQYPQGAI